MCFGPRNGQAIILVVVAASLILIGALGFAIDGGQVYAQRQMAQAAADAAAEAGIMSIMRGTNATSTYTFGTGATPIASSTCTTSDGRTPCVYARNNGFGGTAADTVTLSYPSSVSGATLTAATVPAFEVTVQRTLHTGFIQFLKGPATTSISAKAIAGLVGTVSPDSIFVLDPSAKDALSVTGASIVNVTGGGVAINSSNAEAALVSGSSQINAAAISVVGGINVKGTSTTTPGAVAGTPVVADPLASLPPLTPASCATHPTQYSPPNGTVLIPGTYCGGISVSGIASVTFSAGQYIINGGGLSFGNSAVAAGSNVIFYLTGTNATYASVSATGASTVTLTGPTSGTYQGILFYQDRTLCTVTTCPGASFGNSAAVTFTGTLYFPTTKVSFSGAAETASNMAVVADEVSFAGSSNITYDPTGQKTGLFTSGVALLQ
jgi:Flp pilus assembly protein TadG